jgi:hypothetical protein
LGAAETLRLDAALKVCSGFATDCSSKLFLDAFEVRLGLFQAFTENSIISNGSRARFARVLLLLFFISSSIY